MAKLVTCRACHRRISEEAVKELKGELFCPKCYGPLVAKLKEQRERKKQAEATDKTAARKLPAPGAPAAAESAPLEHVQSPSEKLAAKATGVVGARQSMMGQANPAQPIGVARPPSNLPDLPSEMLAAAGTPRRSSGGFGPDSLGKGVFIAAVGLALFVGYLATSKGEPAALPIAMLALAAVIGLVGLLAGIANLMGDASRMKIAGAVAVAAGLFLAGWGGKRSYADIAKLCSSPEAGPTASGTEPKPEAGGAPSSGQGGTATAVQPKPKPEPAPEPAPAPRVDLRAEVRQLLGGAAAVEAQALGLELAPKKLGALESQPLTAVVLLSGQLPGLKPDLELTAAGAAKSAAELAESMRVGELYSVLRDDLVADATALVMDGGERIAGEVQVASPLFKAAFPFEARRHEGKWRVESFTLRNSARKVVLEGGKWKAIEAPTEDPAIRLARAIGGLGADEVPVGRSGAVPTAKQLALYGELRLPGKPAMPLMKGAPGLLIAASPARRAGEVLGETRNGESWKPLGMIVSGGKGPFLAFPEITTEERGSKAREVVLKVARRPGVTGAFDVVAGPGMTFAIDVPGMASLAEKLFQLARVPKLPVKIQPDPDMPISALVAVVDTCLKARVEPECLTIDPETLAPKPAAPAPKAPKE